jgi:homoserine dehydrogenase
MKDNKLVIGLFGFGVVGEGIYQVLNNTKSLNASVKKICIKNADKPRNAPEHLFTTNAAALLEDKTINVIVELIDDSEAAYDICCAALARGKSVVTANKKMLANKLTELIALRDKHGVSLLYEAAVCGSIPVIRNLEEYYDNDLLSSFSGIVNGSTNFILSKMVAENQAFDEALKTAQELGFAESDPSLDVEGVDAVNKLAIILKHAYGITEIPDDIPYCGITQIKASDIQYAKEKGLKIKLLAQTIQSANETVAAFVLPTFVAPDSQLFNVNNEFNGVLIGSKLADEQFIYGKGAGRFPTSSAVLSDIAALRYGYQYEYKKSKNSGNLSLENNIQLRVYVSFEDWEAIDEDDFLLIEEVFKSAGNNYIVGWVLLNKVFNTEWFYDKSVSLIVLQDSIKEFDTANLFKKYESELLV